MGQTRRPTDPTQGVERKVHLSAEAWLASLPADWQAPSRTWRALSPLPPVGRNADDDAESRLRSILFDPVYQLM
jgi:hypothetical protein